MNLCVSARAVHRDGYSIDPAALRRGEDRDEDVAFGIVPGALGHRPTGVTPFDIGELACVEWRPGQESVDRQRSTGAANRDEPRREGDQGGVGGAPIDRARCVVLGVGVVVAALAKAELRTHAEHRRPARGEQKREQIALVARTRFDDRGIVAWPLDAMVPAVVVVRAVAIVLAVGLIVLAVVGNQVAKREAVMDDDKIDARGRRRGAPEYVARASEPGCDLSAQTRVATPETARGVAKAIVPVGECGRELAKAIASRADVPGFRYEARLGEYGIGGERFEERSPRGQAGVAAAERRGEVEAKSVEPAVDHPALECANRHFDDQRTVEREAIAGARIVDVKLWIVWVEPEPGLVVEATERQSRP